MKHVLPVNHCWILYSTVLLLSATISNLETTVPVRRPTQVPACIGRLFSYFDQAPVPYRRRGPRSRRARDLTGRIN